MTVLHVPNVAKLSLYAQIAVGLATVIGVIYVLRKFTLGVGAATDAIGKPIAEFWVGLTHDSVEVLGTVKMPTGQFITINDIVAKGSKIDSKNQFTYGGRRYEISKDGSGYKAVYV